MDRLRRLDALFASKVLGLPGPFRYEKNKHLLLDSEPPTDEGMYKAGPTWIPEYTRSLDAAWEGVERVQRSHLLWFHLQAKTFRGWKESTKPRMAARFGTLRGESQAAHPAEALVLACLRAVWCSEEELQ